MLKLIAAGLGAVVTLVVAIAWLAIDRAPGIHRPAAVTPADIERARVILRDNDPRQLQSGEPRTIALNQKDLDLATSYIAHRYVGGSTQLILNHDHARLLLSARIPDIPLVLYVNVDATLEEATPLPHLERVRIGQLPIPPSIAARVLRRTIADELGPDNLNALTKAIRKIDISDGRLTFIYEWQGSLEENLRSALLPPKDRERLQTYNERLHKVIRALPPEGATLSSVLTAMFTLAEQRSHDRDPVAENRAALLVLACYVNQVELERLVPEAREWPHPNYRVIALKGRDDYTKHFLVSAIIAAKAGEAVADATGLYKELLDARGASGFSLDDIAADRAGALFGARAAASADAARRLQFQVAAGLRDEEILPPVQDLPVAMSEAELQRRFGGVDTPQYRAVLAEIERRLASLTLYR